MDSRRAPFASNEASAIIHIIYSYRFLTLRQLRMLHSSVMPAKLGLLVSTKHLAAIKRPTMNARMPEVVYALDRRGADLIAEELHVDRGELHWRAHRNLIGLLFLEHRLAANDVRIALTLGSRQAGGALAHWYYEPSIEEDVADPVTGLPTLSFRPDAYFRLHLADDRSIHAFVEVDRGSESYAKIAAKARRYLAYKEHRLFRARVGARSFRVLFTVRSMRRLQALKHVIEEAGGQRIFWLARQRDFGPASFASPIWHVAGSHELASLTERPAVSQNLSDTHSAYSDSVRRL
ncbi:MAG TPA: replication-relaxation family protein [Vicinamibacterales bacterium]|nr:replication-relaxation family protein [Vicinamibacterales bacterium]